jgi:hypothetical protein
VTNRNDPAQINLPELAGEDRKMIDAGSRVLKRAGEPAPA